MKHITLYITVIALSMRIYIDEMRILAQSLFRWEQLHEEGLYNVILTIGNILRLFGISVISCSLLNLLIISQKCWPSIGKLACRYGSASSLVSVAVSMVGYANAISSTCIYMLSFPSPGNDFSTILKQNVRDFHLESTIACSIMSSWMIILLGRNVYKTFDKNDSFGLLLGLYWIVTMPFYWLY